jgi:CxxC motif-containing protein (DUF1111 family)
MALSCRCRLVLVRGVFSLDTTCLQQDEWDLLHSIVSTLSQNLKVPVECKIRLHADPERSLAYAKMFESAGCSVCTTNKALDTPV